MHCPDCGQQQINDEIRFCSRCGFPLAMVSKLVSNRGNLPEPAEPNKKNPRFSRKAGIFVGISWMLFFVLVVTVFLEGIKMPGEFISMAAVFGIFTGVLMILASAFFLGDASSGSGRADEEQRNLGSRQPDALPPRQSVSAQSHIPPKKSKWETNDLAQPSVTEGTTKLLDNDK